MEVVSNFQVITQAPVDCCGLEKAKRNSIDDFHLQNSRDQVSSFKGTVKWSFCSVYVT